MAVTMTFVEEKPVQIELAPSVVLTVADAPEGIKGDSANNVQKTVTLDGNHDQRPAVHRRARRSRSIPAPASTWSAPDFGIPWTSREVLK
jgi:hypothetical protein